MQDKPDLDADRARVKSLAVPSCAPGWYLMMSGDDSRRWAGARSVKPGVPGTPALPRVGRPDDLRDRFLRGPAL